MSRIDNIYVNCTQLQQKYSIEPSDSLLDAIHKWLEVLQHETMTLDNLTDMKMSAVAQKAKCKGRFYVIGWLIRQRNLGRLP